MFLLYWCVCVCVCVARASQDVRSRKKLSKAVRVTKRPQEDHGLYCPRSRVCGDSRFVETQIAYASALRRVVKVTRVENLGSVVRTSTASQPFHDQRGRSLLD